MNKLDLLRQYEPIIKFTEGELFFPTAVDGYIRTSSLWERSPVRETKEIIAEHALSNDIIGIYKPIEPGYSQYLRFVEKPLSNLEYQEWRWRKDKPRFKAQGRLSRVGLLPRLVDAFFDISLLLRGRVPGGTAAAAHLKYLSLRETDPRYVYYGRVLRDGEYIVLHYLFFYVMNNWRSGFYGVNDHEGDWEQVFIYLAENDEFTPPQPVWVAYASHDFSGDDLRRHWNDPELKRIGNHPVIYAGAGSHASYFEPGEYLMGVEIAYLEPVFKVLHTGRRIWRDVFKQGDPKEVVEQIETLLSVPFVDYARGDGFSIGTGQTAEWTPILIDDSMTWIENYRGLWGLDVQDVLGGETAPGGPKYNRNGTVRQSWYDPLGWAGLSKVAPPHLEDEILKTHLETLESELKSLNEEIETLSDLLPRLELEVRTLQQTRHLRQLHRKRSENLDSQEAKLNQLEARRMELLETIQAAKVYLQTSTTVQDLQAHIRHKHRPEPEIELRLNRVAEFWAAISSGLLLIGFVGVAVLQPNNLWIGIGILVGMFFVIDTILHRRIAQFLVGITVTLALVSVGVLIFEFFWEILLISAIGLSFMLIRDNIRELRGY